MKKNSAFSLIELSIVILVIGIIIVGITQSSRLVKQFRIQTAQTMTNSSPVHSIKDLITWFETSLDESFLATEAQDNSTISAWYDVNRQSTRNDASQSTSTNKPLYIENVFNGLPAIRFDGNDNFMTFDATALTGSNYSIFVIEQRRGNTSTINHFLGSSGSSTNNNLHLGYDTNTTLRFGHYSNDVDYTVPTFSNPIPRMHSFIFSKTGGKSYWSNGGTSADASSSGQTAVLLSSSGTALGRVVFGGSTYYFNGDIAEVIIFLRDLKTEERQAVETYLGKKYNIKIT